MVRVGVPYNLSGNMTAGCNGRLLDYEQVNRVEEGLSQFRALTETRARNRGTSLGPILAKDPLEVMAIRSMEPA